MYFPLNKFGRLHPFYLILLSVSIRICTTLDTITPGQPLGDGDTLVSADSTYKLGFFSLADPNRKYLGIWFNQISRRTYVWVANRDTPLPNSPATLNITQQANLVLVSATNHVFWSSNSTTEKGQVPVAQLLNSGNFVVRDANDASSENFLWQSFDHPGNTLLPGMKLGVDKVTGVNRFLSAWKSTNDPAKNEFSLQVDPRGYPQLVLREGSNIKYRVGPWNGLRFTGAYGQRPNPIFSYEFVINNNEVYYKFSLINSSIFSIWTIIPSGLTQRIRWNYETNEWMAFSTAPVDECSSYEFCGAFTRCDINNSPQCSCLDGFMPKSQNNTNAGCVRRVPLTCSDKDGFVMLKGIKLPDTSNSWYDKSIDLAECRKLCLTNCSCTAYASLNITGGGSGCLHWRSDLIDIRTLPENGQEIYVRLSTSELGGSHSTVQPGIIAGVVVTPIIIILFLLCIFRRRIIRCVMSKRKRNLNFEGREEEMNLPIFSLTTIAEATNDFSGNSKLGED